MTNLWTFLLQTLYVSLVGGVLLLLKWLLQDKLTPRWQYGVWSVLALRLLVPVQAIGTYVLLPLPLWVETVKILAESRLNSAFSAVDVPVTVAAPVPWVTGAPSSVTDWLFMVYAAGVVVVLLRYLVSYLRLKALLGRGTPVSEPVMAQIKRVGESYGLAVCPAVVIPGLPSPMVCGVFRPVLALPEDSAPDEHVILHELLHIKHRDALQNIFWCFCRALHWCNPFVWYLMDRIGNDMESLCDQRVLERLEGEERRTYGQALLAMANDQYPRAPGTTSLSNGGKNIARRVEAIVRFKKYPSGMALASVCVTIVLACAAVVPTSVLGIHLSDDETSGWKNAVEDASLNLVQCTTQAGAIDTYAKGMLEGNAEYLALAYGQEPEAAPDSDPFTRTFAIIDYVWNSHGEFYDTEQTTQVSIADHGESYAIHNLRELPDGTLTARIVFLLDDIVDDQVLMEIEKDVGYATGTAQCDVILTEREDGWTLRENGGYILYLSDAVKDNATGIFLMMWPYEPGSVYRGESEHGTVTKERLTEHFVANQSTDGLFGPVMVYDSCPDPNAGFSMVREHAIVTYVYDGPADALDGVQAITVQAARIKDTEQPPNSSDVFTEVTEFSFEEAGWGSEFGGHGGSYKTVKQYGNWLLPVEIELDDMNTYEYKDFPRNGGAVQICWNYEVVEEMVLKEVVEP